MSVRMGYLKPEEVDHLSAKARSSRTKALSHTKHIWDQEGRLDQVHALLHLPFLTLHPLEHSNPHHRRKYRYVAHYSSPLPCFQIVGFRLHRRGWYRLLCSLAPGNKSVATGRIRRSLRSRLDPPRSAGVCCRALHPPSPCLPRTFELSRLCLALRNGEEFVKRRLGRLEPP